MLINKSQKGFTLIEMLVVIAVIAVLVSIIIPTVTASTTKAQAATDAANLRSVMGQLNGVLAGGDKMSAQYAQGLEVTESKMYPGSTLLVVYQNPGFIDAYYLDEANGKYYGLNYFSTVATDGIESVASVSTAKPIGEGYEWYEAGVGVYEETP